jgi:hypothetical protein
MDKERCDSYKGPVRSCGGKIQLPPPPPPPPPPLCFAEDFEVAAVPGFRDDANGLENGGCMDILV